MTTRVYMWGMPQRVGVDITRDFFMSRYLACRCHRTDRAVGVEKVEKKWYRLTDIFSEGLTHDH